MSDPSSSEFQAKVMAHVCQGMHSMRAEKVLCDLKISVGNRTFDCHLLVLASVSGFFRSLTSSSWRENSAGKVTIKHEDVTQESFQMFLDILYEPGDVITIDTATDVLRMSIFLQVQFLEQHCVDFLIAHMTPEVCVGLWTSAEKYQLSRLAHSASTMASDQIDQVVKSGDEELCRLPKSMLLVVLGSQQTLSMDDVCRTILRWVERDAEVRQVHFEELLPFVSFPQLSPAYIYELMGYFDHPFCKHISQKVREAVGFNLPNQTAELKRQILASQDRVVQSSSVDKCAVVLEDSGNGDNNPATTETPTTPVNNGFRAFSVEPGKKFYFYVLKESPEPLNPQFAATCVYRNELYVSRSGNEQKTLSLSKYVPGNNEWEELPSLDFGVEKYSTSAVNDRIYLIGGLRVPKKRGQHGLSHYDIKTKTWTSNISGLKVDVNDAATATVGHRIYVFGGKDGLSKPVDTVQCVDSRSCQVYVAGCLPCPAEEVEAFSDGGTIYLLCDGARVLKMKEHFELAERKEGALKGQVNKNKEGQPTTILPQNTQPTTPSVCFLELGTFTEGKVLSAYLHKGELVSCGTVSSEAISSDTSAMNLKTGEVTKNRLAFKTSVKKVMIRTLNIPREFLNEGTAAMNFQQGDSVTLKMSVLTYSANYGRNITLPQGQPGKVQSINANGTVTTNFQTYGNCCSPASHLKFA